MSSLPCSHQIFGVQERNGTNCSFNSQQVQNKVSFPREPKVSADCRKLVTKILAPLKVRVKIPQILADPWLNPNQPAKDEEVDTTQVKRKFDNSIQAIL